MQGSPRTGNSPPFWPVVDLLPCVLVGWLLADAVAFLLGFGFSLGRWGFVLVVPSLAVGLDG